MKSFKFVQFLLSIIPLSVASNTACKQYYTIQNNDYCYSIAAENGISLTKLKILNPNLDCNNLTAGSSICVKAQLHYSDYVDYISVDGRCGEGYGNCPAGQCCGSDGYCGTGNESCGNGCQTKFGHCFAPGTTTLIKRSNISEENINIVDQYTDIREKVKDAMEHLYPDAAEALEFKFFSEYALLGFDNALNFTEIKNDIDLQNINTEECKARCDIALDQFESVINNPNNNFNLESYNRILEESDQGSIDINYYYNICINQCYLIDEFKEVYADANIPDSVKKINEEIRELDEITSSYSGLIKRKEFDCSIKESNITVNHYMNDDKDLPVYNSNDNSIFIGEKNLRVDGCSAQYKIFDDFIYFFTPACNGHDACYHCSNDKKACDIAFQENMITLCDKGYSVIPRPKALFACKAIAYSVRFIVEHADFASDGYKWDREFVEQNRGIDSNNNKLSDYCVCDDYDMKHFVNKNFDFTPVN